MDGTASTSFFSPFTSPWRNLAWSFRKSRDNWKKKYQALRAEHKRLQNQVRDVRKSREQWRSRAEQTQAENQRLREHLARGPSPAVAAAGEKN